ncbi:hypothetical protein DdX_19467 [Ditylenchus destructor]|uniref:Uncharacterized protein n=1 Tax=Ditylenchus destructor TaxID=166010 RepID=A0AAD4MJM1_9BILA|nr:hypothetical protein DdX_19467 [Ditylenchus destructor]
MDKNCDQNRDFHNREVIKIRLPGLLYVCMNETVRDSVLKLLGLKMKRTRKDLNQEGMPGLLYVCMNETVRDSVFKLLGLKTKRTKKDLNQEG